MSEPGERPALLRPPESTPSPDPLFERGWAEGLRTALDSPNQITSLATELGLEDQYEDLVAETSQRLFELAQPSPETDTGGRATISVTGLVTYAQCPKRFYWTEIDPLPRRASRAAQRGTEVHRRIELHQRGQVPFDEISETLYDVPDAGDVSGKPPYETYLDSRFAQRRASLVESPFTFEADDRYSVRGRIDAVYADGGVWEVVDFKSGRPKEDPSRVVQLQAYAIACNEVDFGIQRPEDLTVTFAYLGDELAEVSYSADEDWVCQAKDAICGLTERMAAAEFDEHPGQWCRNCDFLQFCGPGQEQVDE